MRLRVNVPKHTIPNLKVSELSDALSSQKQIEKYELNITDGNLYIDVFVAEETNQQDIFDLGFKIGLLFTILN